MPVDSHRQSMIFISRYRVVGSHELVVRRRVLEGSAQRLECIRLGVAAVVLDDGEQRLDAAAADEFFCPCFVLLQHLFFSFCARAYAHLCGRTCFGRMYAY